MSHTHQHGRAADSATKGMNWAVYLFHQFPTNTARNLSLHRHCKAGQ